MESKEYIWKTTNVDITTLCSLHLCYSDCFHNFKMAIDCCGSTCSSICILYRDFQLALMLLEYYYYNRKMSRQFNI